MKNWNELSRLSNLLILLWGLLTDATRRDDGSKRVESYRSHKTDKLYSVCILTGKGCHRRKTLPRVAGCYSENTLPVVPKAQRFVRKMFHFALFKLHPCITSAGSYLKNPKSFRNTRKCEDRSWRHCFSTNVLIEAAIVILKTKLAFEFAIVQFTQHYVSTTFYSVAEKAIHLQTQRNILQNAYKEKCQPITIQKIYLQRSKNKSYIYDNFNN